MKIIYCNVLFNGKIDGYSTTRINPDQIEIEVESNFRFKEGYSYKYNSSNNSIIEIEGV